MTVCGVWHPASNLVAREIGDCIYVGPQDLLEAVQGASVRGPVITNRPGEGIKEFGSLDGEAGFFQGLGLGARLDGWFQDHSSFLRSSDTLDVPLLRDQPLQDFPAEDDPVTLVPSLD